MTEIRIKVPEDMTEGEALLYAQDVFNPRRNDYRAKSPGDFPTALIFNDNRAGSYYRTKTAYVLELRKGKDK